MRYQIILVDIDDTLLDFSKSEKLSFMQTLDQYHLSEYHYLFDEYKDINIKLWQEFEKGLISKDELVIKRFKLIFNNLNKMINYHDFNHDFLANLANFPFYIDGAEKMLTLLKGRVKIIGVSNGVSFALKRRVKASGLDQYLDDIIVSEEALYSKPDPRFFTYTFDRCGLKIDDKAKTIILGDSLSSDIQGGINFNIDTCLLSLNKPINIIPTYWIKNLNEFIPFVLKGGIFDER